MNFLKSKSLKSYNTFGIDVSAKYFSEINSISELTNVSNTEIFKNLFYEFLGSINFLHGESYWDKFVVRVAPAKNKFKYREASRIGVHRDTWGTNIHQQINWWAPISSIEETNTMVFFPDYFEAKFQALLQSPYVVLLAQ